VLGDLISQHHECGKPEGRPPTSIGGQVHLHAR
jgi:hypothetical protein